MTLGARPGLDHLYRDFGDMVQFVSVYSREAHPGEIYPHHTSDGQKMRHARDWAELDRVPWPVAVDALDGGTHRAYGPLPNSAYLIGRAGRVAFRALWAGQEGLLRDRLEELLANETEGEVPVVLGEQEPRHPDDPRRRGARPRPLPQRREGQGGLPPRNGQRGLRLSGADERGRAGDQPWESEAAVRGYTLPARWRR